jgi:hypothetical protein
VRIEPLEDRWGAAVSMRGRGRRDPMPRRCSPETTIAFLRLALEKKPEDVDLDFVIELVADLVTDVRGWKSRSRRFGWVSQEHRLDARDGSEARGLRTVGV